ncbi:alpha-esterase-4b isoform X1 [Ceratitis capitata]|uniref:alpha-esterase-4b isoform X1 n=1 Tax=Ceratitis capitata TaxID=7213 RepID=UPI000A109D7E|nr:alpha-esterase-4b isoform X1 [Ceratitis capitata]
MQKKLETENPLPVMVYIHGGGFATGTASRRNWGPDYFMMKDVILVTIGYRLGPLGFLKFSDPNLQVPGNAGLKDIVMALKWLKQNYVNFNGDPNNVTLFGHSAGSCATHVLISTPHCEGLFHKAILLSGLIMHTEELPNLRFRYAKHLGYEGVDDDEQIFNYLNSLEAEKLCDLKFLTQEEKYQGFSYIFYPSLESTNSPDAIITKDPFDTFAEIDNWSHETPLMLGCTSFESLLRYNFFTTDPVIYDKFKIHPEYLLSSEILLKCDLETKQKLANKLIKLHLGERELQMEDALDIIHLVSYDTFYHPTHRYLNTRLKRAKVPTYLYRFDFDSPDFNLYRIKQCGRGVRGVAHVDDLSYIFYMPESYKLPRDSEEFHTIELMMDLFIAFATKSNPNVDCIKPTVWEPLAANGVRKCLNISNEISFIDWPELEKCKELDKYFEEAGLRIV